MKWETYYKDTHMQFDGAHAVAVQYTAGVITTASILIYIWADSIPTQKSWVWISNPPFGPSSIDIYSNPESDVGLNGWHKNHDDDNILTTVIIQSRVQGLYVDISSQTPVYVGYDEPGDKASKNISLIPNVVLPLPKDGVYPGWGDITPIKCYDVEEQGDLMGKINRWCLGTQHDPSIKAFLYGLKYNVNNIKILTQLNFDLTGMPGEKSVAWWTNAKELSEIIYLNMPSDITRIAGLYHDQAGRSVYVGYDDPTDAKNLRIVVIPDVQLPLPVPPAYPKCGDLGQISCMGIKSGYILTGIANKWDNAGNDLLLKKFSYYVTEDVDGNMYLIQGDCDFSGITDSGSLTWWKSAKVLIKKTDKIKSMDKQSNGEINLSQDVNAKFTGKNGNN